MNQSFQPGSDLSMYFGGGIGPVQAGENAHFAGTGNRRTLNVDPSTPAAAESTAAASHPFLCGIAASSTTPFVAGSINGVPVTGTVNVSVSGTQYVYAKSSHAVDISTNGYVGPEFSGTPTYTLESGSSVPSDSNTAFHLLVATYVNGTRTAQHVISSLFVRPRDDGNGTSTAVAYWWGGTS